MKNIRRHLMSGGRSARALGSVARRGGVLLALLLGLLGNAWAAEKVTYYYTNEQGTVLATADANGVILSRADYRPYGTQALGSPEQGPGYTGHVNDADTGLVYMQQRYYDPDIGRFLSADPIPTNSHTGGSFNRYAYANNNPYTFIDPDGRQALMGMPVQHNLTEEQSRQFAMAIVPGVACALDGCGVGGWAMEAAGVLPVGRVAKLGKLAIEGSKAATLSERVAAIHGGLDNFAASRRTTAVLETKSGTRIVGGGASTDLNGAQKALMLPNEVAAALPGAHAEVTTLTKAASLGEKPHAMETSWNICPACKTKIEQSGGTLTSPRTAEWRD